jgi:hypothetical protein
MISKIHPTQMKRRELINLGLLYGASTYAPVALARNDWGESLNYPIGWDGRFTVVPEYRVGNYSGGFEKIFPHHIIRKSENPTSLNKSYKTDFHYRWGLFKKSPHEYLNEQSTTGLLICREGDVFHESYRYGRQPEMRFTSWSMAKSITSLLLGICIDKKFIDSYDDPAKKYVPDLEGSLHGEISLRNLSNMSSGAEINHQKDNSTFYPQAFTGRYFSTNLQFVVKNWNKKREDQGLKYNYNELCPLTIGWVIRKVTGMTLSEFAEKNLWRPMGAAGDATWTTDSKMNEFNCIGFAATLQDWGRLGMLVANRGKVGDDQIVSDSWIKEITSWSENDKQVQVGVAGKSYGYKAHMWHKKTDGSLLWFNGFHGQKVIIDMPTKTVLVHTAVSHDGNWEPELFEMFEAAKRI